MLAIAAWICIGRPPAETGRSALSGYDLSVAGMSSGLWADTAPLLGDPSEVVSSLLSDDSRSEAPAEAAAEAPGPSEQSPHLPEGIVCWWASRGGSAGALMTDVDEY